MRLFIVLAIIPCVQLVSAADRTRDQVEADALVKQAVKAAKTDETITAINLLTESLERCENGKAYVARAGLWFMLKKFDLVIQDCDRALQLDPKLPEAYQFRAMARLESGELAAAVADASRGTDLDKNDSTGVVVSLVANCMSEKVAVALKEADRLVELEPDEADSFIMRGRLRHIAGDLQGAEEDYKRALALDENDAEAMYSIACLVFDQPESTADYPDVVKLMERACSIQSGKDDEWEHISVLAALHAKQGDLERAIELQERAVKLVPQEELAGESEYLAAYKKELTEKTRSNSNSK